MARSLIRAILLRFDPVWGKFQGIQGFRVARPVIIGAVRASNSGFKEDPT